MKTEDYLIAILVVVIAVALGVFCLAMRQVMGDVLPHYDPVEHDLEQALRLLWRLIDLVAERCGR